MTAQPISAMEVFHGLGVAEGVSCGTAVCVSSRSADVYQIPLAHDAVDAEVDRYHKAVAAARAELVTIRERVGRELGEDLAGIFEAQALLLDDQAFGVRVEQHIRDEQVNAEWAIFETTTDIQRRFDAIDSTHIRERSEDLRDVSRLLLRHLQGIDLHSISEVEDDIVIVADDLTPSDTVRLGRTNVAAFAIEHGGATSHATIIARSLNLPAVVGVTGIRDRLIEQTQVPVIVDGNAGTVVLNPDRATRERYERRRFDYERETLELINAGKLSAVTRDDVEIQVMANIDLPEEIADAKRYGAAGVGLYRSEFLYIEKSPKLPSEDEHVALYRQILEISAPHPAIIRTYDLGGRKIAREMMETEEANPVLGLRGIRLTLARPEIFRTQLRALLRASVHGDLWIMLPLVSVVEEVRQFRQQLAEATAELEAEGLPFRRDIKLGIMMEVPAAAMIADILAREVDFFSIGTNDLIQYSMAVDRNNEHVSDLYQPLHPGMIRLLRQIVGHARAAGIPVSLCGEAAADVRLTPVLLGCGLRRLSVSPRKVPAVKRRIRELSARSMKDLVNISADLESAQAVADYLAERLAADQE